jgi:hypothetical protein
MHTECFLRTFSQDQIASDQGFFFNLDNDCGTIARAVISFVELLFGKEIINLHNFRIKILPWSRNLGWH